ncbi:MAG: nucleotidyltransferase domain-containing protein [Chitinophagales bacterium]
MNTVSSFAGEVKKQGVHLKKVFLFGSFAANRQHEYSDNDVALVADEFTGFGYDDMKLFLKTLRNYTIIQPKTYPTSYFNEGDPFVEEIRKTGIEIKW